MKQFKVVAIERVYRGNKANTSEVLGFYKFSPENPAVKDLDRWSICTLIFQSLSREKEQLSAGIELVDSGNGIFGMVFRLTANIQLVTDENTGEVDEFYRQLVFLCYEEELESKPVAQKWCGLKSTEEELDFNFSSWINFVIVDFFGLVIDLPDGGTLNVTPSDLDEAKAPQEFINVRCKS